MVKFDESGSLFYTIFFCNTFYRTEYNHVTNCARTAKLLITGKLNS